METQGSLPQSQVLCFETWYVC